MMHDRTAADEESEPTFWVVVQRGTLRDEGFVQTLTQEFYSRNPATCSVFYRTGDDIFVPRFY